jgi:hypothetical protein
MWPYVSDEEHSGLSREEEQHLRAELIQDISPLLEVQKSKLIGRNRRSSDGTGTGRSYRYPDLQALIAKINTIGLTPSWYVDFDQPFPLVTRADGSMVVAPNLKTVHSDLGADRKILKFGPGDKWVVRSIFDITKPREFFYGNLVTALQSGDFTRLRRCPECSRFFIAPKQTGPRRVYCSVECTDAADKEPARKRARNWREKQHRKKLEQRRQAAERQNFRNFSEFMKLARKTHCSDEERSKRKPILSTLGQGDTQKGWKIVKQWEKKLEAGSSLEKLWSGVTKDLRKIFEGGSL